MVDSRPPSNGRDRRPRPSVASEVLGFLSGTKWYWIASLVLVAALLLLLLALGRDSVGPHVYPLF